MLSCGSREMFCKLIDGECGRSVFKLDIMGGKIAVNGEEISLEALQDMLSGGDFIFQDKLEQHPEMARLHPSSLNTIRLTTVRNLKTGEIRPWLSALRIGVGGLHVDNLSQGGIIVGFDLEEGHLNAEGIRRPEFGRRVSVHPDSGVVFADFTIPFWKEAKEKAIQLHSMLKDIHSIGWDIAITSDGPVFIEGNDNWEITVSQAADKGMRKEFEEDFY